MKFRAEFLKDMDYSPRNIHEEIIDIGRWETTTAVIFEHKGKFYKAIRVTGNTENQENLFYGENPDDEQECPEVHKVERIVKVWEVIEN